MVKRRNNRVTKSQLELKEEAGDLTSGGILASSAIFKTFSNSSVLVGMV